MLNNVVAYDEADANSAFSKSANVEVRLASIISSSLERRGVQVNVRGLIMFAPLTLGYAHYYW